MPGCERILPRTVLSLLLVALAALSIGCGDDTSAGKDLQVQNAQDTFQFQVTDVRQYSHTYEYTWANSGTAASVNQACSISGGTVTLLIYDDAGALVYARDLKQNGTFPTSAGSAGNWRISVVLHKATGNLNFRAQKV